MQGKVAILESMVSVHCTTLLGHVIMMRPSCFNTNFAPQMKLTKLPFIHCCSNLLTWGQALVPPLPSTYRDSPHLPGHVQSCSVVPHHTAPHAFHIRVSHQLGLPIRFWLLQEMSRTLLIIFSMYVTFWDFFNKEPWSFGEKKFQ